MQIDSTARRLRLNLRRPSLLAIVVCSALLVLGSLVAAHYLRPFAAPFLGLAPAGCCSQETAALLPLDALNASVSTAAVTVVGVDTVLEPCLVAVAGSQFEFQLTDGEPTISRDVEPTWGSFDENTRIYTAPSFMPPLGIDEILVRSEDGLDLYRVTVRIVGDSVNGINPQPRFVTVPVGYLQERVGDDFEDFDFVAAMDVAGPGRVILLEEGETYAPPLPIENLRPIEQSAGNWDVAPAMRFDWEEQTFFVASTLEVRRVKDTPRPQQGETRRPAPVLETNKPCKEGDWYFTKYVVTAEQKSGPTRNQYEFKVEGSIGGKIGVSAGTVVTVVEQCFNLVKQFTRLAYRCRSGNFRLVFRQKCSKPGIDCRYSANGIQFNSTVHWFNGSTTCNPPATGAR
ncbi:MAG: hypothetical protein ACK4P3_08595 [Fimbriimonadaceae bacterium]